MGTFNSAYTGTQIDSAVGRALPNGAIDTSLSNKADSSTHNLKTYTSLEQVGATTANTLFEVIQMMPNYSELIIPNWAGSDTPLGTELWHTLYVCKQSNSRFSINTIPTNVNSDNPHKSYLGCCNNSGTTIAWTPLATATTPTEYDLPLNDGYTSVDGYACAYSKTQEGIVSVNFTCSGPMSSTYTPFAVLPSGYRPSGNLQAQCAVPGSNLGKVGRFVVQTNGTIAIQVADISSSGGTFGGAISFVAGG